jgi:class 3 adenylate cyclase/tetratricopeptide (TPR) repeat protein
MQTVKQWLEQLGLPQYTEVFTENDVDLEALRFLTDGDLERLGISLGNRKKLLNAIAGLDRTAQPVGAPDNHPPQLAPRKEAERRQLTVLFCDLVGSTELATKLDPEQLRDLMEAYQRACGEVIERYDGHVAQYLGDGLMVYFGWPRAHEDDAVRAIRTGLEIIEAVSRLNGPTPLRTRVGMHTGLVVVGETGQGDASVPKAAVGETPNIAARLQGLAEPGTVVVSERTRALARGVFNYADLGAPALKGITQALRLFSVTNAREVESRFDAAQTESLTPLVGREAEIALLKERWHLAQDGEGQVVLLSGEPGIGKSRMLSALRVELTGKAVTQTFQCSPYHTNSAFYPSIDALERALKLDRNESVSSKLDKLEELIVSQHRQPLEDVRFIASALSIASEERYGRLDMTPQRHKEETVRALANLIAAGAREQAGVTLFEDVHWADPSTLEVLDLLVERIRAFPMLLVLTHRPEFRPQWSSNEHAVSLGLSRLSRGQSRAMVMRLTGGKHLPGQLADQIVDKTDGVPLFVEELTKAILESGSLEDAGDRFEYAHSPSGIAIPSTLRDSLMARLDRFPMVKEIAQIGAAIGREFSYELISAVAPMSKAQLDEALEQLAGSGLAFRRGTVLESVYTFKHALVQDAAYDSLLKSRRQVLHEKIADALEKRFPAIKETRPELLAHHLTAAGLNEAAIDYWRKAGQLARKRSALAEAISHWEKGVELVGTLAPSAQRDAIELDLRTRSGNAWIAMRGWAAPEVEANFSRALRLAKALDHRPSYVPVIFGLFSYHLNRGRAANALNWAREAQDAAQRFDDDVLRLMAHRIALVGHFFLGHLEDGRRHADRLLSLYDEDTVTVDKSLELAHPLVGFGVFGAPCAWLLGYPDQAMGMHQVAETQARKSGHPFSLCFMLLHASWIFDFRGEPERMLAYVDEVERLSHIHRIPLFSDVTGPLFRGIAHVRLGNFGMGVQLVHDGLHKWTASGGRLAVPYWKSRQAEAMAHVGNVGEALGLIEDCLTQIERPGWEERVWLSEVLRLKGSMLERQGKRNEAEQILRSAIQVAREQQARSWELRASTTLARFLIDGRQRDAARELLTPIYGWFTEGFDTRDLKEAKTLLDELS